MTQKNFRLVFKDSPFLPILDIKNLLISVKYNLDRDLDPASAICSAVIPLLTAHFNMIKLNPDLLKSFEMTETQVDMLAIGFFYPIQTILASKVCGKYQGEERVYVFEELLIPTGNFRILEAQDMIFQELTSYINLLKIDPSCIELFKFIEKYPPFTDEFFLNGLEVAAILFYGIAQELTMDTSDDSWLMTPPTIPPNPNSYQFS